MKDCKFNPPTNGKKGFHYVVENGRPRLLTRKDLKDLPKDAIAFKLPSEDGSRKLRMKAQSELVQGLSSGVLPMSWELQPCGERAALQRSSIATSFGGNDLEGVVLVLDTFDASGFNLWTNTKYDIDGFDKYGRDVNGFDRHGNVVDGYDWGELASTGSRPGNDPIDLEHQGRFVVLDAAGRDSRGFNAFGVNSPVDELWPGEKRGFNKLGQFGSDSPVTEASLLLAHDENGFDAHGIHRESRSWLVKRTSLDRGDVWEDAWGRTWMSNATPRDNRGFDLQGTLADGSRVDSQGFNAFGVHEATRTMSALAR
jgi:hypothetical protein